MAGLGTGPPSATGPWPPAMVWSERSVVAAYHEYVSVGTGPTHLELNPDRDYVIDLPDAPVTGPLIIDGGRDVVIVGGHIVMEWANPAAADVMRRAIYIKNSTGTVLIKNVFIEGRDGAAFDAVAISAPQARVELLDLRVERVSGSYEGFHGDIVQPFGGVRALFVDGLTGTSNYQGFYLKETRGPIGSVELRNVNLRYNVNAVDDTTFLLWLDGCNTYPIRLWNVYIEPRYGQSVASHAVWPTDTSPSRCAAAVDPDTGEIGWPRLDAVDGVVISGAPPGGDFVPGPATGAADEAPVAQSE